MLVSAEDTLDRLYPTLSKLECCGAALQEAIVKDKAYIFHSNTVSLKYIC